MKIKNIKQNHANELLRQAHTAGFLSVFKKGRENLYTPTKKELDIIDVSSIDFTDEDFQKWYNENFSDKKYELVYPWIFKKWFLASTFTIYEAYSGVWTESNQNY